MESSVLQPQTRVLQHVPRWAIIRTIRQQSVAEHSYYVSLYATWIADKVELSAGDQRYVTIKALTHDFGEMVSGDIPTPYKANIAENKGTKITGAPIAMEMSVLKINPSNEELCNKVLKLADLFEAAMYLADEWAMGNKTVQELLTSIQTKTMSLSEEIGNEKVTVALNNSINKWPKTRLCTEFGL